MAAPDNRVPFGYVPTWMAFQDTRGDAAIRVLVALQAYGASAHYVAIPVAQFARAIHRERSTVYRALRWLTAQHILVMRMGQRDGHAVKTYRAILSTDEPH